MIQYLLNLIETLSEFWGTCHYYEVQADGTLTDNRAGSVYARADITGAAWFSFLSYSSQWQALTRDKQNQIEKNLPFRRTSGEAPLDGDGYWATDRSYAVNGIGARRRIFRPY